MKKRPEVKMHAPMYLNGCFSETNKQKKTPTQDMKHTTYPFCYINHFGRTLGNLLYEKGLLTTGGPSNKGIVASQKRHPVLSFDSQSNR